MAANAPGQPVRPLRVLVDTNIVLDQLLQREPWHAAAQPFWQARDAGRFVAYLPASTVTDIFYIARRHAGLALARQAVERCLREFGLLPVSRAILESALALPSPDFEDNVQIACAHLAELDLIVTRNAADFRHAPMPSVEPAAAIGFLRSKASAAAEHVQKPRALQHRVGPRYASSSCTCAWRAGC